MIENEDGAEITASPAWERPLAEALHSILTMPFENAPPLGYSNLENALQSAGFGSHAIREKNAINTEKLRQYCINFYGKVISKQYFSKLSPAVPYRLFHWKLTSPERYALLTVLSGLTIDELLGSEIHVTDLLQEKLPEYKSKGTAYRKEELAKLVGITPHQLDSLAKKYNITPFWKQCGGNRTEAIRITLTASEKQSIERQIRNIKTAYPDAAIIQEAYKGWCRLFGSVSRMSRNFGGRQ